MSIRIMVAVFDALDLTSTEKLVALALADHCHDDGTEARPGLARLSRKTSLSEDGVRKALRRLIEKGVLIVDRPATSHRPASHRFTIGIASVDVVDPKSKSSKSASVDVVGASLDHVDPIPSTTSTRIVTNHPESSLLPDDVGRAGPTRLEMAAARVYGHYPKKVGRIAALRVITALLKNGEREAEMLGAIDAYVISRVGEELRFMKDPATFFGRDQHWREWTAPTTNGVILVRRNDGESEDEFTARLAARHAESKPMPDKMKDLRKQMRGNL